MAGGRVEVRDALDLCLACRGCVSQCPTGVDMAAYKSEFLDHHYRRRLRPLSHYSLGWLPLWLKLTARVPRLVNAVTRSRLTASSLRAGSPASPHREASRPSPGAPSPATGATQRGSGHASRPGRALAGYVQRPPHPGGRHAAVRVLEAAGFEVIVPGPHGLLRPDLAHHRAAGAWPGACCERSLGAPELGGDEPVLVLEPSCATMLRADLPELLPDDPRAARLARRVATLAELLDSVEYVGPPPPAMARLRPSPSRTATSRRCWASTPTVASVSATASTSGMSSRAAAAWPATSGPRPATRGSPSRSPSWSWCRRWRPTPAPRCWPMASAAAPRSSRSRAAAPGTSPRSSPSACRPSMEAPTA